MAGVVTVPLSLAEAEKATGIHYETSEAGYAVAGTDTVLEVSDLLLITYAEIMRVHQRMDSLESQAASLASPDGIMGMIGGFLGGDSPLQLG